MTDLEKQIKIGTKFLATNCSVMNRLVKKCEPCVIELQDDLFFYLCRSVIFQQLSGKAATTIFDRWLKNFKTKPSPIKVLKLNDEQFQNSGVSRQKRAYIRNISHYWKANKKFVTSLNSEKNETIIKELTTIKGVGEWTVQMLLMFAMGRLNVFPVKDLAILKALQKNYALQEKPTKAQLKKIAGNWGNYASIASWYLWRSLDG